MGGHPTNMTSLFLEYEQNTKVKKNPALLVGQTRYWSKSYHLNTPLTYHPHNVFVITDVISSNIVKYRYLNGGQFISDENVSYILEYSSIVPTNDESIS